ncbi:hypothetical protein TrispH2_012006 [Trichoplax sp. H2]|nr:hypothetical protein TrispH2_012006 [Trichoplax sp. H2]|eukprot:RDD35852.1 hypothetical protein TrispH2_012006 [Trichoplax sp. H2]
MNFKLVLIACLLFVATAYAAENDEIPEEIEKELADIEHPIEDREDEENEILAKEAELENLKEDEMKENAVKAALPTKFCGGEGVDAVDEEFSLPDVRGGTSVSHTMAVNWT